VEAGGVAEDQRCLRADEPAHRRLRHAALEIALRRVVVAERLPRPRVGVRSAGLAAGDDALVSQHRLETVDFVKIDVEGSESAAVRGMAGLLSRSPAPIVFYEANGHTLDFYDESCQGLKAAFANLGYRSFYVDVVGARLVPVEPDDVQPDCFVDYLAIKPGSYDWHDGPGAMIGSWPVAAPLTRAEWRSWLRSVCRDDLPQLEVAHVVREFAGGPDWVRRDWSRQSSWRGTGASCRRALILRSGPRLRAPRSSAATRSSTGGSPGAAQVPNRMPHFVFWKSVISSRSAPVNDPNGVVLS
jgi:Methyltransferase FkbM domain